MRVLLLDDEALELEQLEVILQPLYPHWSFIKACNGKEAIQRARELREQNQDIQLAFVDINLPGRNGLEVVTELKKWFNSMDIIVISAVKAFEHAKQSLQLKAVDYLVKPVIETELLNVVTKYLSEHPQYSIRSEVVEQAISIVHKNYHQSIKLVDLAQELHMNANYFSRVFSSEMGISFSDYVIQYRIEMAKQLLLKHKNWSIQRVAEETGFNSQHYFSKMFKKMTAVTPKEYRKV